ncbi:unnamed protein product, partial [Scytosiphon promiscuus]
MDSASWNQRHIPAAGGNPHPNGYPAAASPPAAMAAGTAGENDLADQQRRQPGAPSNSPSPAFMPPAVGVDAAEQGFGGGGSGTGGPEDGTSRTSSAYILLQLRDLGRSASNPDAAAVAKKQAASASAVSPTAVPPPPALGVADGTGAQYHHFTQQQQELSRSEQGPHPTRYSISPTSSPPAHAGGREIGVAEAAAAALERGMYVPGLSPEYNHQGGGATVPAAEAAAR